MTPGMTRSLSLPIGGGLDLGFIGAWSRCSQAPGRVMNRSVSKHAEELSQERVSHRAQSPAKGMAFRSQRRILLPA